MLKVFGWLICFGLLVLLDLPLLRRTRNRYEKWLYGFMIAVSLAYSLLYALNVPLPDPNGWIKLVFGPLASRFMRPAGA